MFRTCVFVTSLYLLLLCALAECPAWVAGRSYNKGDIVSYKGQNYIAVHPNPGYDPIISHYFWDPTSQTCNSQGSESGFIVSEAQFNSMFPDKIPFYSYQGLTSTLSTYPDFTNTGDENMRKREVAAFLANVAHETDGLKYIRELNEENHDLYCDPDTALRNGFTEDCVKNGVKFQYYGRGPIQLSWNFNYNAAGKDLGIDLLHDPDIVATNSEVAWKTGIWFWMTRKGAGTFTPHEAIVNGKGFGETIRSINGNLECDRMSSQVERRVKFFESFVSTLGTDVGPGQLRC